MTIGALRHHGHAPHPKANDLDCSRASPPPPGKDNCRGWGNFPTLKAPRPMKPVLVLGGRTAVAFRGLRHLSSFSAVLSKYPPAEPGALEREPLKAAVEEASACASSCDPTLDRQNTVTAYQIMSRPLEAD